MGLDEGGGPEPLRRLGQSQLLPRLGGHDAALANPLHGVGDGDDRHDPVGPALGEGGEDREEQLWRGHAPRRVVDKDRFGFRRYGREGQPHGLVPGSPARDHRGPDG